MTQGITAAWKPNAACCLAQLTKTGEENLETFRKCCYGKSSALLWRVPILLWSIGIISWSMAEFWGVPLKFLLYMTHWGLILIILESVFGVAVALKSTCGGKPGNEKDEKSESDLPWYVKTYWVLYNITIPVAFLITVFYWAILRTSTRKVNYAPNPILDAMLHGANSVVMLVELMLSAQPSRLHHIMQPLYFALAYILFNLLYYAVGGTDPWGNPFIYPVVDWSKPLQTMVVVTLTALFLALMHLLTVALASARDVLVKRCNRNSVGIYEGQLGV